MTVHIVQKGDTLWKIAKQHQIPFDEIKRLNAHLANPDYIVPGMEIFLPDTANTVKRKKEAPIEPQVIPMPVPQTLPKKEMPVKETPRPPVPTVPPQVAPIQTQPPSWLPYPQPIPMPMPYPQQMPPIVMPQQPITPQTIRIEQPQMPMPIPLPMPQQPVQPMPMQCPSCRMTVMIAMPHMQPKEEVKEVQKEHVPIEQKRESDTSCSPTPMPRNDLAPWMQPAMPIPWGGSHCRSCHQPVHVPPSWSWPMQPSFWPQATQMPMNESTSNMMQPIVGAEQWQQPDLKCEMQQHIVNQYYDEIREIEQSNRPCHPHSMQSIPYFHQ